MKNSILALVMAFTIPIGVVSCVKPPVNLTPQDQTEFVETQAIEALDNLRDFAANSNQQGLLSASTTIKVIEAHESIINVMVTAGTGWQNEVTTALTQLLLNLPQNEVNLLTPYVNLAKTAITAVN